MSVSDSMFLIDVLIEELCSYVGSQEFYVKCQFGDIFNVHLKDPNKIKPDKPKKKRPKKKESETSKGKMKRLKDKTSTGQSIIFKSSIKSLIDNMQKFPLQISVWDKDNPYYRVGSSVIPWSPTYYQYLHSLYFETNPAPVHVIGGYNIFDEDTSKRVAVVRLNVKLTCLKDKLVSTIKPISTDIKKTFMEPRFSPTASVMFRIYRDIEDKPNNTKDTGVIKTTYSGGKHKQIHGKSKFKHKDTALQVEDENELENKSDSKNYDHNINNDAPNLENIDEILQNIKDNLQNIDGSIQNLNENRLNTDNNNNKPCKINSSIVSFVKSDTNLDKRKHVDVRKSKSCCLNDEHYNILSYIYGNNKPYVNNVYCVNYFTVHSKETSPSQSEKGTAKSEDTRRGSFKFRVCSNECPSKSADTCSVCSTDLPAELAESITVTKCKQVDCQNRIFNEPPTPPDNRILIQMPDKIEEVTGEMKANMQISDDNCFCTCECTFGFIKKTTYCKICGGYEKAGDDLDQKPPNVPFPCPIFHKLVTEKIKKQDDSLKSLKIERHKITKPEKTEPEKTEPEKDKDSKKGKKKKKDDRFKFNYGYKGIPPQIGHSRCALPCTGTLVNVPKEMGWLWTAENVPGLKFRPNWKPGAANKHVVRMLKIAKNPGEVIKKRRRETGKKKRPLKRPLLVVHKKEGEYTVTMETMKNYHKPRQLNQQPYEDKPVLTYTIGRTEEENKVRQKKKEREQRRIERCQREFIQSAFRDMCREICLKTYQQALGILPGAEDPECMCYPLEPGADRINVDHSCSCSEDKSYVSTDTDSDEWLIEFTPPVALYDPTFKGKKTLKVDNTTQYTYMDYKVNLVDAFGNPVPRFFKGPDGKTQCSDLGGFWGPNHKWLEINVDGYVALDGRWAPMTFTGPSGEQVDSENGKFQTTNGAWLMVGIDGFVDCQGKWKFYPKPRGTHPQAKGKEIAKKKDTGDKEEKKKEPASEPSLGTWTCFGDATPQVLSKMGIVGHGHDKKLLQTTLKKLRALGEDVKIPEPSTVPRLSSAKSKNKRRMLSPDYYDSKTYFLERQKCKHSVPSEKGIIAVDGHGHKAYFKLKDYKNKRPKERLTNLTKQGISLSAFHVPCFHSFINSEMMKQQLLEKRMKMSGYEEYAAAGPDVVPPPRGGAYPGGPVL